MPVLGHSEHSAGRARVGWLKGRAVRMLDALGRSEASLSLLLTDDRGIRALNRRWRGIDRPTDVLSFAQEEGGNRGPVLGDVVISLDTAVRRARALGVPVRAELARYLAHGILHLLGHDHARPAEARRMAAEEERLLGAAGLVGVALGAKGEGREWINSRTSTSTRKPSGSTARGTRARSSPARSSR